MTLDTLLVTGCDFMDWGMAQLTLDPEVEAALTWYSDEVPKSGAWEMVLVVEGHYAWEQVVVFQDGKPDQSYISFEVNRSEAR